MMTAEQLDAFSEIVSGARDEFNQAYQNGPRANTASACAEQIENLAFAAEMADISGLDRICHALGESLTDISNPEQLLTLVHWTDQVLAFIRNPEQADLAEQVVACLPEAQRAQHLAQLLDTTSAEPAQASARQHAQANAQTSPQTNAQLLHLHPSQQAITSELQTRDFATPDACNDDPTDLQQLLISELKKMAGELGKVLDEMFGATFDNALDALKARYNDAVQCLADTASITGLKGLEHCCQQILLNLQAVDRSWIQANRSHCYLVFRQWPGLVLSYLQQPANDEHCMALINHLELQGWPQPITETHARDLLQELIECGTVQDDSDPADSVRTADPADMDLTPTADLNQDLLDAFLHDGPAQAAELSACVNALTGATQDKAIIAQAQRITHTLKGAANIVGIPAIANLAHVFEDVLERLRTQAQTLTSPLQIILQSAADCIEAMVDNLHGKEEAPADRFMLYQQLVDILNAEQSGPHAAPKATAAHSTTDTTIDIIADTSSDTLTDTISDTVADSITSGSVETVRVPLQVINSLFQLAEEITIALGSTQEQTQRILKKLGDVKLQDRRIQEQRFELENVVDVRAAANRQRQTPARTDNDDFDSLEMDQYDEIYDVAHALIEAVADSRELNRDVSEQILNLDTLLLQQSRLNKELQRLVKHTRMVPAQTLVPRLQRCIRHATRVTGKLVDFAIDGSDTEINEEVLDKLVDPLMHLLRNAVDHGIEPAQQRLQHSKSSQGNIKLSFAQDGQHILIRCDDDGAGLNREKIRQKAIQRGLIEDHDQLTPAQIHQLLLSPGFTTKDSINQVSGRGIGMDAVHKRIRELGGQLAILDNQPSGTRFEIKVPLQLVASHALLVQLQQHWFAIPTRQLNQILPPGGGDFSYVGSAPALTYADQIYPAHHLASMLGFAHDATGPSQWQQQPVLLTQNANEAAAICVDAVIANQDLVIKATGDYVKNVPGVAGVAILGDGRLVPVLDLPALLERRRPLAAQQHYNSIDSADYRQQDATVLIVDDSLSVRKSLSQLLGDSGYRTDTARDGLDAWDKILQQPPAVILVDMEMPRMNGIELTSRLRNNELTRNIPVLMITSRSTQKHRSAADKAGVTEYFTKPFTEADLLNRIHHYLAQPTQAAAVKGTAV